MTLIKREVTVAARVMLPTYVVLTFLIGVTYLTDPLGRLDGVNALSAQRSIMSMKWWGTLFIAISLTMALAFRRRSRAWFVFGLYACAATMGIWAALYTVSIFTTDNASVTTPMYPLFVAIACHASAKSLLAKEQ